MSAAGRRQLRFTKYSGAGNDFLVVDSRHEPELGDASQHARALCRRGTSVGADGLILLSTEDIDPQLGAVARMRLWNADGSWAAFSGNAARCAVRYLVDEGLGADEVRLQTDIGLVTGRVRNGDSLVSLPGVARVYPQRRIRVEGKDLIGTYVLVGVPFFVLLHDDPDQLPIRYLGRTIRNHPALAPDGANVDFVRVDDEQSLYFRVYERGVENETLSSGTGSVSAALAAAAAGRVESPVACTARGGILTVRFRALTPQESAVILDAEEEAEAVDPASTPGPATGPAAAAPDLPAADDDPGARSEPADAAARSEHERAADERPRGRDEGGEETVPEASRPGIAGGAPLLYGDIRLEGETRRVMEGTAFADALRLR